MWGEEGSLEEKGGREGEMEEVKKYEESQKERIWAR